MARAVKPRKTTTRSGGALATLKRLALGTTDESPESLGYRIAVDFPQHGELVASREYTFRVSTPMAGAVEISVDEGPWMPCRPAEGFWWHDWSGYDAGPHQVRARVNSDEGFGSISEPHEFFVELS